MTRPRWIAAIVTPLAIVLCSTLAHADAPGGSANDTYLSTIRVSKDPKIIWIIRSLQDASVPFTIDFYRTKRKKNALHCTLANDSRSFHVEGCGLVVLGGDGYGDAYAFLAKTVSADWVEIYVDQTQKRTLWLPLEKNPLFETRTEDLIAWLIEEVQGLPLLTQGRTKIHTLPKDSSKVIGKCGSVVSGWNSRSMTTGLIPHGVIRGDWAKVHCESVFCYSPRTPNLPSYIEPEPIEYVEKLQALRREHRRPCVEGWIRWRSKDGRLLVGLGPSSSCS